MTLFPGGEPRVVKHTLSLLLLLLLLLDSRCILFYSGSSSIEYPQQCSIRTHQTHTIGKHRYLFRPFGEVVVPTHLDLVFCGRSFDHFAGFLLHRIDLMVVCRFRQVSYPSLVMHPDGCYV